MPPSFWVYLLRCADGSYYARLPVELAWSQECPSRIEALNFERQIKGWARAKKEALIRGDWAEVSRLAKSKGKKLAGTAQHALQPACPECVEGHLDCAQGFD